ncbi:MAG: acyltransferase family protein [Oscillospiraceae bacterium]|nr:acyltransferase family protein [Oscillospiraceae bacterium]
MEQIIYHPETSIVQKKRIEFIDVFRAYGIFLMIMGHIGFGSCFDYYIHAFHMPIFYFVSGYFFQDKGMFFGKFFLKKANSLLLPYYTFGFAYLLLDFVKTGMSLEHIKLTAYHLLIENTNGLPIAGALWFLTSIFFTEMLFLISFRMIKSVKIRNFVLIGIGFLGSIWVHIVPFRLPLALDTGFAGIIFYLAGNQFKIYETTQIFVKLKESKIYCSIIGLEANAIFIFLNGYVNMREGIWAIIPLSWFNAVCAILLYWNFSACLEETVKTKFLMWCMKIVKSVGHHSIIYLLTNQIVIMVVRKGVACLSFPNIFGKLLTLFVSMFIMYLISVLFARTRLCVLIGRKYVRT